MAYEKWPDYDPTLLIEDLINIPVQINGKLRDTVQVPNGSDSEALIAAAKESEKVQRQLEGKTIVKEIVVPAKLVNFVVR